MGLEFWGILKVGNRDALLAKVEEIGANGICF